MAAYSMDLRKRVLADSDAGLPTKQVAEKYGVSRTWVRSLKQRRRETGNIAPRVPTGRPRKIDRDQLAALVRQVPDATLVELRDKLGVACTPTAIWMALDAMRITLKKSRCAPPSKSGRTSPRNARGGKRGKSDSTRGGSFSSTKRGRTRR
jgi:transposase